MMIGVATGLTAEAQGEGQDPGVVKKAEDPAPRVMREGGQGRTVDQGQDHHHREQQRGGLEVAQEPQTEIKDVTNGNKKYKIITFHGQRERSPHTNKLRTRVTNICGYRRRQPNRSAMGGPLPGGTAFMITVSPVPGEKEQGQRERSPHTNKLRTRVTNICGYRRRQPNRSAMGGPLPGGTAFMITVSPVPGIFK
ncbi:hypothetical protein MAR_015352 [Mya arenaria]|uniref:Uncharacterized protein n=1 Tax=Mya arenaria TaxID=6604 RepID=A0ABY7FGS3_MYAAR|nr:hypothetical protein MAR_015352 [Mya arenaria]